jgi:hypothetical protein
MAVVRSPLSNKAQQQAAAEQIAVAALAFLAAESERFARFLEVTGFTVESIRTAAQEPGFLVGVLDHFASDEALLLAFAAGHEMDPADVLAARNLLAGPYRERDAP